MTNREVIECKLYELGYDPKHIVVDTFDGWNRRGYIIKRGEHAKFSVGLWETTRNGNPKMVNKSFYTSEQVEKKREKL